MDEQTNILSMLDTDKIQNFFLEKGTLKNLSLKEITEVYDQTVREVRTLAEYTGKPITLGMFTDLYECNFDERSYALRKNLQFEGVHTNRGRHSKSLYANPHSAFLGSLVSDLPDEMVERYQNEILGGTFFEDEISAAGEGIDDLCIPISALDIEDQKNVRNYFGSLSLSTDSSVQEFNRRDEPFDLVKQIGIVGRIYEVLPSGESVIDTFRYVSPKPSN